MPNPKPRAGPSPEVELLEKYRPLVFMIASGFMRKLPRNVLREDLIAAGMSGVWDAIRRNPCDLPERFEWYLRVRIRGAILDELRAQDWLPRRARAAAEAAIGTDAYLPIPKIVPFDEAGDWESSHCHVDRPIDEVDDKLNQLQLEAAISRLPVRMGVIVRSALAGEKHRSIAKHHGISEPRVSQILKKAQRRLREELAESAEPNKGHTK